MLSDIIDALLGPTNISCWEVIKTIPTYEFLSDLPARSCMQVSHSTMQTTTQTTMISNNSTADQALMKQQMAISSLDFQRIDVSDHMMRAADHCQSASFTF
jgi:hypothetical protein